MIPLSVRSILERATSYKLPRDKRADGVLDMQSKARVSPASAKQAGKMGMLVSVGEMGSC